MSSNRPYLIRALYQWIIDNGLTPYLLVDATVIGVEVPHQHVSNGKITLNIHPNSIRDLSLENDWFSFSARFSGISHQILFPAQATLAIYAKENGQGMKFNEEDRSPPPPPNPSSPNPLSRKPTLRIVK
ncbi:ClpXP protease specificity-enhancing factor [Candidatus Nitrosoglobus terrae]|nr:ClpXP protease specificity-enhancing factor [Candidatus Nitrosoglobus terrae]